eukprot:GHUV01041127.1.p1 GENE.GHUV01041127.1~~GHUV01041127.1.p1  ORF type:complete len:103 (-),score=14.88 GHUV01041127.1:394-702(-)
MNTAPCCYACLRLSHLVHRVSLLLLQVKALKEGKSVEKPIYNHVTGNLDAPETTASPDVSHSTQQYTLRSAPLHSAHLHPTGCYGPAASQHLSSLWPLVPVA